MAAVWDAVVGAAAVTVGLLVALTFGGTFLMTSLGAGSITVGTPGTPTLLFEYANAPETVSTTVGFGVPVLGALAGVAYAFARSYRRHATGAG